MDAFRAVIKHECAGKIMSNIYFKADCDILTDPKLIMAGPEGFTMYMKGLAFAKLHLTDGSIPEAALSVVGIGIKNPETNLHQKFSSFLWIFDSNSNN